MYITSNDLNKKINLSYSKDITNEFILQTATALIAKVAIDLNVDVYEVIPSVYLYAEQSIEKNKNKTKRGN